MNIEVLEELTVYLRVFMDTRIVHHENVILIVASHDYVALMAERIIEEMT